jgi:hypothetical protein
LILLMGMANRVTVKTDSWGYALLLCAWKWQDYTKTDSKSSTTYKLALKIGSWPFNFRGEGFRKPHITKLYHRLPQSKENSTIHCLAKEVCLVCSSRDMRWSAEEQLCWKLHWQFNRKSRLSSIKTSLELTIPLSSSQTQLVRCTAR